MFSDEIFRVNNLYQEYNVKLDDICTAAEIRFVKSIPYWKLDTDNFCRFENGWWNLACLCKGK